MPSGRRTTDSPVALYCALGFLLVLILLGGGTRVWSQALCLIGVGGFLIWKPPLRSPGKMISIAAVGLFLLAIASFFPIPGGFREIWWVEAVNGLGIHLSPTISAQPRVTAEGLAIMTAGLGWFCLLCSHRVDHRIRRRMLWLFSLGVGLLGVGIIVGSYFGWKYPFAREASTFSYFPNRNQTSSLLFLGGIIAFGLSIDALRRRRVMTIAGFLIVIVIFFALIFSLSRAGIFLFFSGCIIWLLCSLDPSRFTRNFVLATSGLILIFSVFVFFGGETLKRVSDFVSRESGSKLDFRQLIYKDTTQLILDQPVTGVGLGNFSFVFPQYRDASASSSQIIHPESDWFWLGAELGLPGVCLAAIGMLGIWRGCWTMESRRERRYRILIFAALFVFVIHSFVDVPGHRLGTFMAASFLYGLTGLKESRERPLWMAPLAWRIVA